MASAFAWAALGPPHLHGATAARRSRLQVPGQMFVWAQVPTSFAGSMLKRLDPNGIARMLNVYGEVIHSSPGPDVLDPRTPRP